MNFVVAIVQAAMVFVILLQLDGTPDWVVVLAPLAFFYLTWIARNTDSILTELKRLGKEK